MNKIKRLIDSLGVWESDTNRIILTVFYENADKEFQFIDIWKIARFKHEVILRQGLTKLRRLKWLVSRREGKVVYYKANVKYFLKVKNQIEKL